MEDGGVNSYYLVLSGFFAWFGVPLLTLLAAWWLSRRAATTLRKVMSVIAALAVGTALFVWLQWFHNPLPSDETLIKHFNEHRAEFEQLVKGARNYRLQVPPYVKSTEGKALATKLRIGNIRAGAPIWFPDPYSERTAHIHGQYFGHSYKGIKRTPQEQVGYWKNHFPELFEGAVPVTMGWQMPYMAGAAHLGIGKNVDDYLNNNASRLATFPDPIVKRYVNFPQPPRVEDSWLLEPTYDMQDRPTTRKAYRVFDSLDGYPPAWERGECVLKRIDAQWFIAMCRFAL